MIVFLLIILGCAGPQSTVQPESDNAASLLEAAFAYSVRLDAERVADHCALTASWDSRFEAIDQDRVEQALNDWLQFIAHETPVDYMDVWFYSTVMLDTLNAYAADGCEVAQMLIVRQIDLYNTIWEYPYLEASLMHDVIHAPSTPPPLSDLSTPDPTVMHEILQPDPIITQLQITVQKLESCAAKHQPPLSEDYASVAAIIRGQIALAGDYPDKEQIGYLTFQMENANAMLVRC